MRMYQDLWNRIARADERVVITCSGGYAKTLIQAVRKEKSIANILRRGLGMPRYGMLLVTKKVLPAGKVEIEFRLAFNGDKI